MNIVFTRRRSDDGFPLKETLVVMIIVGLLASIAVPLFLDQQKKSHDAATKSDVDAIAKLVAAHVSEYDALPTVAVSGSTVSFDGKPADSLSEGVVLGALTGTDTDNWCISATHPAGDRAKVKGYKYTATEQKVEEGQCP